MRSKFHIFQYPCLKKFTSACNKIESDPNFQPDITDKGLLSLVVDGQGNARHTLRRSALAIQPMNLTPRSPDGNPKGVLYQIKIAKKGCIGDSDYDYPVWHIDDSAVIFINKEGEISFHSKEKAKSGKLTSPLDHLSIDDFLNCGCLHYLEENNNKIFNF